MAHLGKIAEPKSNRSQHLNKVIDAINSNNIGRGSGVNIRSGDNGTIIRLPDKQANSINHRKEWNDTKCYDKGDIVTLTSSMTVRYINPITTGSVTSSTPPGTYICEGYVPQKLAASQSAVINTYLASHPNSNMKFQVRQAGVAYEPIFPELPYTTSYGKQGNLWRKVGESVSLSTYQFSSSYRVNEEVMVTGSTIKYYNNSESKWSYPGHYRCVKNVPEETTTDHRTGSIFVQPIYPVPTDINIRYWELLSMGVDETTLCDPTEGGKTFYIHAQEKQPTNCPSQSIVMS